MKIDFILFDTIGTLVKENGKNGSVVVNCFIQSFKNKNINLGFDQVKQFRGYSKMDAVKELLRKANQPVELADFINSDFVEQLKSQVSNFEKFQGTEQVFDYLKNKNIKIGIGSGLPKEILMKICEQLNWEKTFDYYGSSEDLGIGRPDPIMIFDAMNKLGINNTENILKVGDTVADIMEGKNAGTHTAVVLSGTQNKELLLKAKPDFIFEKISALTNLV